MFVIVNLKVTVTVIGWFLSVVGEGNFWLLLLLLVLLFFSQVCLRILLRILQSCVCMNYYRPYLFQKDFEWFNLVHDARVHERGLSFGVPSVDVSAPL